MKLPNFRLYNTQATAGVVLAVASSVALMMLAYVVFRGADFQHYVVRYNEQQGLGRFRNYVVLVLTAGVFLAGCGAAILGFSSLGQKRNNYPGRSWLGLILGAVMAASAPVLWLAWRYLREAI